MQRSSLPLLTALAAAALVGCGSSSSPSPDAAADHDAAWPWANAEAGPGDLGGAPAPDAAALATDTVSPDVTGNTDAPTAAPDLATSTDGPASAGACGSRTGGALVTLSVCANEKVTLWITNGSFITEAIARKGKGKGQIPSFELLDGRDCDAAFTWHVNPASAAWADLSTEVCDGCPHLVEQDKASWLKLGRYCPWSAAVDDVVDRR